MAGLFWVRGTSTSTNTNIWIGVLDRRWRFHDEMESGANGPNPF